MNTNPDAKRILIFSDSLSWGYIPNSGHVRFPANVRWSGKLQDLLGTEYEIIEENLNSRAIESIDPRPGKEGRKALDYIIPCLDTHDPLDYVFVLLGTNELKEMYNQTPLMIGGGIERLLKVVINRPSQFRLEKPTVVLISPIVLDETTEYASKLYKGATQKAKELPEVYSKIARDMGIDFISLEDIVSGEDGVHIDESQHAKVARKVYEYLKSR